LKKTLIFKIKIEISLPISYACPRHLLYSIINKGE